MKISTSIENAPKMVEWVKGRGGVAVWKSVNLSDPDRQMLSPALTTDGKAYPKPHWSMGNEPSEIVKELSEIEVNVDKEVKRFHVAVRPGAQGFSLKLTDASSRRVRAAEEKAGKGAYNVFDYFDEKNCIIMAPEKTIPLTEWMKEEVA